MKDVQEVIIGLTMTANALQIVSKQKAAREGIIGHQGSADASRTVILNHAREVIIGII